MKCSHPHYPWNFFAWLQCSITAMILLAVKCCGGNVRMVRIGTVIVLLAMMGIITVKREMKRLGHTEDSFKSTQIYINVHLYKLNRQ